MFSSIIYEAVDFVYTVGRITIRSITGLYSWFHKNETPEQLRLRLLEERIVELEEQHIKL